MRSRFYVAKNGEQMGPWSVDEIVKSVAEGRLLKTDYIYDEKSGAWSQLDEFAALAGLLPAAAGAVSNSGEPQAFRPSSTSPESVEWFVLKGESRFGPFGPLEIVKMLQSKGLFEHDFVWRAGWSEWRPLSLAEDFSPTALRELWKSSESSQAFFRRRHARMICGSSLLVHDKQKIFRARAIEIGAGGAALEIEGGEFEPGQELYLHFRPGEGVPPFNALCKVISRRKSARDPAAKYGVSFLKINPQTREYLDELAASKLRSVVA